MNYCHVFTTTDQREVAQKIAHHLVQNQLAACVQISGPIESVYRWQGEVQTAQEWVCSVKTSACLYTQVEQAILKLHNYELPEILQASIEQGHENYLEWIGQQLRAQKS